MELLEVVFWTLVIAFAVFQIVVMVAVLRVANEALPYFRRLNADRKRAEYQKAKDAAPWAYE